MAVVLFRGADLAVRKGMVKFLENLACLPGHFHRERALGIKPFNLSA
jgi:hypothetical protein